jgi:hypothetical protein
MAFLWIKPENVMRSFLKIMRRPLQDHCCRTNGNDIWRCIVGSWQRRDP